MSKRALTVWGFVGLLAVLFCHSSLIGQQPQPLTPDAAAAMVLDSARRAYNEGKQPFAAERFREFLKQYPNHKDVPAAQYGLALSLLESPQKDPKGAMEALQQVVGRQDFPDRAFVLYYLAGIQRDQGYQALADAVAKPNEAGNLRSQAQKSFYDASKNFAAACDAFSARLKAPAPAAPPAADDPPDRAWLVRSRCDQCEMLLRLEKFKEAGDLARPLVEDKTLAKSPFRALALYHLGYASFAQKDYKAAGTALGQLAPFQQEFGVHARYLLARVHHLSEERPEAVAQYKALQADFEQQKKSAAQSLQNPGVLTTEERARLEALTKGPPDYILRASFYAALLLAEQGKYSEALDGFNALVQIQPRCFLVDEAQLRQGYCQLQLRNYAEVMKALPPLHGHAQLGDRALCWTARAQIGAADANNAQVYDQALRGAIDLLGRAANQAGELGKTDPEAKIRRGDILLELADTQQLAKQYPQAAGTYQQALTENNNPDRAEEAMQRLATALHLAGQYKPSDEACVKFEQTSPKSTLLPAAWFRAAENARLTAMAAAADPNLRGKQAELDKMFEEAVNRYQRLLKKYPEFAYVNLARYGLGLAQYQLRRYTDALTTLTEIPQPDRIGDLLAVPYLMADCHVRLLPAETDDGLKGAQLLERAEQAAKLLEGFLGTQDAKSTQVPDALLKQGYCYQRMGMALADPAEKQKLLSAARQTYEKIFQQFNNSPAMPPAVLERAKCMVLQGDAGGAINELNRFTVDPLRTSPIAPLAQIRLAGLLRSQNRTVDAVNLMVACRQQFEGAVQSDPDRNPWIPLMQYEHALAVKESGKLADARSMFENLAKQFAGRPEADNSLWRAGQCRREELLAAIATAKETITRPGVQTQQIDAAVKAVDDGLAAMRQTAEFFKAEGGRLAQSAPGSEAHLRVLYETAWCYRALADAETTSARQKLQRQALDKAVAAWRKTAPPNQPAPNWTPPPVAISAVPPQPSEKAARDAYMAVLGTKAEAALLARTRLELAEMLADRGENDAALEVLAPAMDVHPPQELAERIRLRAAACLITKKDAKAALAQIQPVTQNAASKLAAEARYLTGEAHLVAKDWANAIAQLTPFRDQDPFKGMPELADRALLRLGYAFAQANRWDESRQALEALVQRFPQSPWIHEARYGMGWAWQNANQHDNAVNTYAEVTRGTAAEVAARAQLQMGLCRLTQKRFPEAVVALLVVSSTYEYPEHSAAALCEAGQAQFEMKQNVEAAKLWEAVIKDHGSTRWADVARQRLSGIKK